MVRRSTLVGLSLAVMAAAAAVIVVFLALPSGEGGGSSARSPYLVPDAALCTNFLFRLGGVDVECRQTGTREWTAVTFSDGKPDQRFRAGEDTVRHFLDVLATTPVQDWVSRDELHRRGFAPQFDDAAEITLSGARTNSLFIATNIYENCVCVLNGKVGRDDDICIVESSLLEVFPSSALAFRDDRLFPPSDAGIGRMELRFESDVPVLLFRQPSGWFVHRAAEATETSVTNRSAIPSLPADGETVANLLKFLARLRFRDPQYDVEPSNPVLAEKRCDPANAASSLRIWSAPSGTETILAREYYFGSVTNKEGNAEETTDVPVYIRDERLLVSVDRTVPLSLSGGPERFRDHHILPGRSLESLVSLRIRPERGTATLFRREGADSVWRLALPALLDIDTELFADFLKGLFSISDDGLAPLAGSDKEGSKSDPPLATIEWTFADGGSVTASVYRVANDSGDTLWTLPGESQSRMVSAESAFQGDSPWEETLPLRLVRPEIPGSSVVSLAPDSVGPYGLLVAEEYLLDRSVEGALPIRILLGDASPSGGRYAMLRGGYVVYDLPPEGVALAQPILVPDPPQEPLP